MRWWPFPRRRDPRRLASELRRARARVAALERALGSSGEPDRAHAAGVSPEPAPARSTLAHVAPPEAVVGLDKADESRRTALFQTLLNALPLPILLEGPDGRIVAGNRAAAEWLGRAPEELVGQSLSQEASAPVPPAEGIFGATATLTSPRTGRHYQLHYVPPAHAEASDASARAIEAAADAALDAVLAFRLVWFNDREHPQLVCQAANSRAVSLLGRSREDLVGQPLGVCLPVTPQGEQGALDERCLQVARSGASFEDEYVLETHAADKDTLTWLYLQAAKIQNGLAVTVRDITPRKRDEAARRYSEERLQFALESTRDGLIDWEVPTGYIYVSTRWLEMLGLLRERIMPHISFWESLIHPDDRPESRRRLEEHFKGATPAYEFEHRLRHRSGKWIWVLGRMRVVQWDGDGTPLRVVGTTVDISHLKQVQADLFEAKESALQALQEVRASEIHLRAILDHVVDGILTVSKTGLVMSFNSAAERIFGFSASEVVGRSLALLMPEALRIASGGRADPGQSAFRSLGPSDSASSLQRYEVTEETEGRRRDGELFPVELAISEVRLGPRLLFIAVVRDITERKKIETMKNEFVSTVSHELRTPLTSIRGSLGLVANGAAGEVPERARGMVDIALKNSERLVRLINDILDIEKIESGRMEFSLLPQDVMPVVEQALEDYAAYADRFGVRFRLVRRSTNARAIIDADKIHQVLANLLSNAAKFSPSGDEVAISVDLAGSNINIQVKDNGPGVPENLRDRIFEKFAQADSSSTRQQQEGTGLGLSIAKAIVERHQGWIGFESEHGQGSTFYFCLPWADATELGQGPSVLICQRARCFDAGLTTAVADGFGARIDIVRGHGEAKRLLAERNYRVLLWEIDAAGIESRAFLRSLREHERTAQLAVLSTSTGPRPPEWLAELEPGALTWLPSPPYEEAVFEFLEQHLGVERRRVLYVENDHDLVRVIREVLGPGVQVQQAGTLQEARAAISQTRFDLVLLDLALPDGRGEELIQELDAASGPRLIVFSAYEPRLSVANMRVLVKSKTSNEQLLEAIRTSLKASARHGAGAEPGQDFPELPPIRDLQSSGTGGA